MTRSWVWAHDACPDSGRAQIADLAKTVGVLAPPSQGQQRLTAMPTWAPAAEGERRSVRASVPESCRSAPEQPTVGRGAWEGTD